MERTDALVVLHTGQSSTLLEMIGGIAAILVANLFFFEPDVRGVSLQRILRPDQGVMERVQRIDQVSVASPGEATGSARW